MSGNGEVINLFDLGVLVQLNVGFWGGRKMLTRADLVSVGINPDELPEDIVNLGRKLLVPKEEIAAFSRLEQRARLYLGTWSIPFGIGSANFVPIARLQDVQHQLDVLRVDFFKAVDSFITRFDEMKTRIQEGHPDFWEKCLRRHYPSTAALLRKRFKYEYFVFKVAGVSNITGVTAEEAITQDKVAKERETLLRAKMQAEVETFVEDAVGLLRAETVRFCDLVSARVNGTPVEGEEEAKKLTTRSIGCFAKYVERFRTLNLFGDAKIEKLLQEFTDTYLKGGSVTSLQQPQMQAQISEALAAIRKAASQENGELAAHLNTLKRKIVL